MLPKSGERTGRDADVSSRWRHAVDAPFSVITAQIIGAAIEVHRTPGPGLLESTYMPGLQLELSSRKLRFVTQRAVPIVYKGMALDAKYRIDLIVEDLVVVEPKSVDRGQCIWPRC